MARSVVPSSCRAVPCLGSSSPPPRSFTQQSLKIASLFLRTLSKPIATKIKQRAKDHDGFKTRTIAMAQFLHRAEMNLRVSLLGESPKHIRPLSESRAIESGANFLSEGFLFAVAATIILGETYRSRASESKRRDAVRDQLDEHAARLAELGAAVDAARQHAADDRRTAQELSDIVEQVVVIGLKGGFGNNVGGAQVDDEEDERAPRDRDEDDDCDSSRSRSRSRRGDAVVVGVNGRNAWERHLRVAELARAFRTTGRVLRDDDEADDEEEGARRIGGGGEDDVARERGPPSMPKTTTTVGAFTNKDEEEGKDETRRRGTRPSENKPERGRADDDDQDGEGRARR
ncbi:hypothetical protein JCM11491_000391 [Sporobolomyces phaffii]